MYSCMFAGYVYDVGYACVYVCVLCYVCFVCWLCICCVLCMFVSAYTRLCYFMLCDVCVLSMYVRNAMYVCTGSFVFKILR